MNEDNFIGNDRTKIWEVFLESTTLYSKPKGFSLRGIDFPIILMNLLLTHYELHPQSRVGSM
jgi:hypothetical protein